MKRSVTAPKKNKFKNIVPDAVYTGDVKIFTVVDTDILKNPNLSGKAKIILCILLSNRKGWKTYIKTLSKYMKEGKTAINNAVQELKEHGYMVRIFYRDIKTKKMQGSFIAYTQTPFHFNLKENESLLRKSGLEPTYRKPVCRKTELSEKRSLIILNNNNIKSNSIKFGKSKKLNPSMFNRFYKIYPKKVNKGAAVTAFNKLCNRKEPPTLSILIKAVKDQSKTKRWQDKKFIPNPSTWLNQSRWLDEIEPMNEVFGSNTENTKQQKEDYEIDYDLQMDNDEYRQYEKDVLR